MLVDQICTSKRLVRELRAGPLGPHFGKVEEWLARYTDRQDARGVLLCAGRFARYADDHARASGAWDHALLMDYLLDGEVALADAFYAARVRSMLQDAGLLARTSEDVAGLALLDAYEGHVREVRGLSTGVRRSHVNVLRRVLSFHRKRHAGSPLSAFTGEDALDFFRAVADTYRCTGTRQKFAGELRQVLRFLHFRGALARDLASTVPLFINYRLSTIPKHLPWDSIKKLVAAIDVRVAPGKRDRAILLLIAGLGLRPGTVQALTLDHIHWRSADIRIPRRKGGRGLNVPLSEEVGQALSDYVLHERPQSELREVFLCHTAPHGMLTSSSAISSMIYGRLQRAGLPRVKGAANLLRHSLATQLVNAGVPIKQVSDVFGHASIDTTAVYTKVDLRNLSKVPMPFALRRSA